MTEFVVTLISEDGPFFSITADDFEITRNSYTHMPYSLLFSCGNKIICTVSYKDVYEIGFIENDKYLKLLQVR